MRRSGIYVLMNGTWHRKSSYIDARLAGEVGRPGAAIIAIFDAATGDYRVVEESGVEEAVSVEASVRHAGLRWRVSTHPPTPASGSISTTTGPRASATAPSKARRPSRRGRTGRAW